MVKVERIEGNSHDPLMARRLHALGHGGSVEHLHLHERDLGRRRLLAATDAGTECAIALQRSERLFDGAVLYLDALRAIVVRVGMPAWMRVRPRDSSAALRLGYTAGNLHWRVRFDGTDLLVAIEHGDADPYRARLAELLAADDIEISAPATPASDAE